MHSMSTEEWHAFVTCGAPTARPGGLFLVAQLTTR